MLDRLLAVTPSERQMAWQQGEYYIFVHFGRNTFYGREWGTGKLDIKKFNPVLLATGTAIGYKEIKRLAAITVNLTLTVTAGRREPHLATFAVYQ